MGGEEFEGPEQRGGGCVVAGDEEAEELGRTLADVVVRE
jgi:hypothetical protein